MSLSITCPKCGMSYGAVVLPDSTTSRCPNCRTVFAVDFSDGERMPPKPMSPKPASPTVSWKSDAPAVRAVDDYPSIFNDTPEPLKGRWQASLLCFLLALCAMLCFGCIVAEIQVYRRVNEVGRVWNMKKEIEEEERLHRYLWLGLLYASIVSFVVYLAWVYAACKNMQTQHWTRPDHSPRAAVLNHFIPIVNLFFPYMILQELWKGSDPTIPHDCGDWHRVPGNGVIGLWWFTSVIDIALGRIAALTNHPLNDMPSVLSAVKMQLVLYVVDIVMFVLWIVVISSIANRQRQKYERIFETH